jgi:hypothetical protein
MKTEKHLDAIAKLVSDTKEQQRQEFLNRAQQLKNSAERETFARLSRDWVIEIFNAMGYKLDFLSKIILKIMPKRVLICMALKYCFDLKGHEMHDRYKITRVRVHNIWHYKISCKNEPETYFEQKGYLK